MHDIKTIRHDPGAFDAALKRRGLPMVAKDLLALDGRLRSAKAVLQESQERRNDLSGQIGALMRSGQGDQAEALKTEVASLKDGLQGQEAEVNAVDELLRSRLAELPNILSADVPDGLDETANIEIRQVGALPDFDFKPRDHVEIGRRLGLMDFETAAAMSGARFVILQADLARLERALAAFMLDMHTQRFGYSETYIPHLVRDNAVYGTGQLPKFADDLFKTGSGHWLIPTAEVSLTNLVAGKILKADQLPMRFTAYSSCFRSEAGAAGQDTHGMIRQHQFSKVELVSISTAEQSADEHERMTSCAEEVLKQLELPYRVVTLCSGDTGFSAQKTYDIEVWLPGQGRYREISSCSNCGPFQARRLNARYRCSDSGMLDYVHTLNGSGLAVGRTLIAVLENYQHADGSVTIPSSLRPYMGGLSVLSPVDAGEE